MDKGEQALYDKVEMILDSKVSEFELYHFTTVTKQDLWEFAKLKFWKKKRLDELPLHQIVADLYAISPSTYMSVTQIQQFKSENWFSELKKEDLEQLLNPR